MTVFTIAIFRDAPTSASECLSTALTRGGYNVTSTTKARQFRADLSIANCALVLGHPAHDDLFPSRLERIVVPPVLLITPLSRDPRDPFLPDRELVQTVLEPPVTDRALISAATQAVVTNICGRISYAAAMHPGLSELLRAAINAVAKGELRRVTSVARELHVSTRALEAHWARTFGPSPPHLKDFCRGMWFLRLIRIAARDPTPSWSSMQKEQDIPRSTLRAAAIAFTGKMPSDLNLLTEPATIIANVCTRAVPPPLHHWALGQ